MYFINSPVKRAFHIVWCSTNLFFQSPKNHGILLPEWMSRNSFFFFAFISWFHCHCFVVLCLAFVPAAAQPCTSGPIWFFWLPPNFVSRWLRRRLPLPCSNRRVRVDKRLYEKSLFVSMSWIGRKSCFKTDTIILRMVVLYLKLRFLLNFYYNNPDVDASHYSS